MPRFLHILLCPVALLSLATSTTEFSHSHSYTRRGKNHTKRFIYLHPPSQQKGQTTSIPSAILARKIFAKNSKEKRQCIIFITKHKKLRASTDIVNNAPP